MLTHIHIYELIFNKYKWIKNNKYPNCHVWEFHIIELMRSKLSDNRTN